MNSGGENPKTEERCDIICDSGRGIKVKLPSSHISFKAFLDDQISFNEYLQILNTRRKLFKAAFGHREIETALVRIGGAIESIAGYTKDLVEKVRKKLRRKPEASV